MDFLFTVLRTANIVTENKDMLWCLIVALIIFYYKGKDKTCNHHAPLSKKIKGMEDEADGVNDKLQWLIRHIYLICPKLDIKPEREPPLRRECK